MWVATVLTACGIETPCCSKGIRTIIVVATVLTACGIETLQSTAIHCLRYHWLQQYLPLAVLKLALL